MRLDQLDLIVKNVPAATAFFRDVLGLTVRFAEERFAELDAGDFTLMLSPDAMVPTPTNAAGVILHFHVENVAQALEAARSHGAKVLLGPLFTDWGTESVLIAGPEQVIIDLYRPIPPMGEQEAREKGRALGARLYAERPLMDKLSVLSWVTTEATREKIPAELYTEYQNAVIESFEAAAKGGKSE